MLVPPLSERPVTEEDEERFWRESQPRKRSPLDRWAEFRAEARSARPKGAKARFRSWMKVDAFSWGMRTTVVLLVIGGFYALYINGVAEGWWRAWGDNPNTVTTATPEAPPPSSEPAMSGGYQIGPDGVLVRPAEHAASTYTKPELPEEAKENTERGAEAAAEHYLALMVYAWNTGNSAPLVEMSDERDDFHQQFKSNVDDVYSRGWTFGNKATIDEVLRVRPLEPNGVDVPSNTISVVFSVSTSDGTTCAGHSIAVDNSDYQIVLALLMTWKDNRWVVTQGTAEPYNA